MRRGAPPKGAITPARKGTFSRLMKVVAKGNVVKLVIVVLAMILSTIANIMAITQIRNVIGQAVGMLEQGSTDFTPIVKTIVSMVILYTFNMGLTYLHSRLMIDISQDTLVKLRRNLFDHMVQMPVKYFDQNQHGDLMSLYTNDIDATRQMISQSLPQLIVSGLSLAGYLIAMFVTSYILTFIMAGVGVLLIVFALILTSSTRKLFRRQQIALGKLNGYIEEMVEGQKVIKIFRREPQTIEEFGALNQELYEHGTKANKRMGTLIPTTINIGYLSIVILAIVGTAIINSGIQPGFDVAALVVFIMYARNFTGPINQASNMMNFVAMAIAGADRVFIALDTPKEEDNGVYSLTTACMVDDQLASCDEYTGLWAWQNEDTRELVQLTGDVRFFDVTFGYNPEKPVLKDISLYAKRGQKIAFVGATGAGKTTIANLINRFYDIQEGEITFDGINIKDIKKDHLRNALGMVLQDTHLFTATVKDNIKYGNLYATDEQIVEAAKRANAHEFITKLPQGYDTMIIHNGENLSQGQRQLLSIARAAVSNPPVLILDEATSSVDTHTEKLIQDGMDSLMEGRTVFVIAHRLSTIKNSNVIIVLSQGEIIERGNHDALVEQEGQYYQLYTGAFELE